jgi:hypothetical protein
VIVVVACAVPLGPVAVSAYVVVCFGETVTLPEGFCVPIPLSIETALVLMADHDNVAESPELIVDGFAVKLKIAGPGVAVEERVIVNVKNWPGYVPGEVALIVLPLIVAVKGFGFPFSILTKLIELPLICPERNTVVGPESMTVRLPGVLQTSTRSLLIVIDPVIAVPAWIKPPVNTPENGIGGGFPHGTIAPLYVPAYVPVRPDAGGCVLVWVSVPLTIGVPLFERLNAIELPLTVALIGKAIAPLSPGRVAVALKFEPEIVPVNGPVSGGRMPLTWQVALVSGTLSTSVVPLTVLPVCRRFSVTVTFPLIGTRMRLPCMLVYSQTELNDAPPLHVPVTSAETEKPHRATIEKNTADTAGRETILSGTSC